jgi:hypothetical protein
MNIPISIACFPGLRAYARSPIFVGNIGMINYWFAIKEKPSKK